MSNGDGTWSLRRTGSEEVRVDGAFTWRYARQATFAETPTSVDRAAFVIDDRPPLPLVDQVRRMRRYRPGGEVWVVDAVDESLLDPELVAAVDAAIAGWTQEDAERQGEVESWEPTAWVGETCTFGGTSVDVHVWDGESRERITADFTDRQLAAVLLTWASGEKCTGTRLNSEWIVTSAHCVEGHDGSMYGDPDEDLSVRDADGNYANVSEVFVTADTSNDDYNWTWYDHDYADDWALIQLESAFNNGAGDMDLYQGADSAFEAIGANVHNNSFPFAVLNTSDACVNGSTSGWEDLFSQHDALVTSTANARTKWKTDGADRQSGSSFYFCPEGADDVCAEGEVGMIVALFSGWNSAEDRYIGPKVSAFAQSAITFMNNH